MEIPNIRSVFGGKICRCEHRHIIIERKRLLKKEVSVERLAELLGIDLNELIEVIHSARKTAEGSEGKQ